MKNIVVAVDLEPGWQEVAYWAAPLAKTFGAKLWLVHALPPDPEFVGYEAGPQSVIDTVELEMRKARELLKSFAEKLSESGLQVESLTEPGTILETVIEQVHAVRADCLLIGHRKRGFLYRMVRGNIANSFLKSSPCPVTVVPITGTHRAGILEDVSVQKRRAVI